MEPTSQDFHRRLVARDYYVSTELSLSISAPSSNRTCGFPAYGSPEDCRHVAHTDSCTSLELGPQLAGYLLRLMAKHLTQRRGFYKQENSCLFFRGGAYAQADLLSYRQTRVSGQAPLLHGNYPASPLLWACPTPGQGRSRVMFSPGSAEEESSPCRASQVPRPICRCAPSPTTPESPTTASACCFIAGSRLHHLWKAGHSQLRNEAESGSLALRLTPSSARGFVGSDCSVRRQSDYIGKQAIPMVNTSQFTRLTRLGLAHQSAQSSEGGGRVYPPEPGFCPPSSTRSRS